MKRLILALAVLAVAVPRALAQDNADPTHVTVNVGAERLENLLTDEQKQSVTHLTVTGTLQEADYAYLRAGLLEQLAELNLRDADIDTIPAHAFDCEIDRYPYSYELLITLPTGLKHLSDYSLCIKGGRILSILTGAYPTVGKNVYSKYEQDILCRIEPAEDNRECKSVEGDVYSTDGSIFYRSNSSAVLSLPEGVQIIYACAFENCYLSGPATLPSTVDSIGDRAFANVMEVIVIGRNEPAPCLICNAVVPPKLGKDVFAAEEEGHGIIGVFVPDESVEQYKQADGWKKLYIRALSTLDAVGIKEPKLDTGAGITITSNDFAYTLTSTQNFSELLLYGADGRLVSSASATGNCIEISKSSLSFPVTIVRVNYSDGTSETLKLRP